MAVSRIVQPSSGSNLATILVAPDVNINYSSSVNLSAGTYNISHASGLVTEFIFWGASDVVATATTISASGTVQVVLSDAVTKISYIVTTGSGNNITISISQVGGAAISNSTGIIDTISSTGTYNGTGTVTIIAIGGGGAGGLGARYLNSTYSGGTGGGSGYASVINAVLNSPTPVTAGAGGLGANQSAGGTTNFGNIVSAAGGSGGNTWGAAAGGAGGSGGGGSRGAAPLSGGAGGSDGSPGIAAPGGGPGGAGSGIPLSKYGVSVGAGGAGSSGGNLPGVNGGFGGGVYAGGGGTSNGTDASSATGGGGGGGLSPGNRGQRVPFAGNGGYGIGGNGGTGGAYVIRYV